MPGSCNAYTKILSKAVKGKQGIGMVFYNLLDTVDTTMFMWVFIVNVRVSFVWANIGVAVQQKYGIHRMIYIDIYCNFERPCRNT